MHYFALSHTFLCSVMPSIECPHLQSLDISGQHPPALLYYHHVLSFPRPSLSHGPLSLSALSKFASAVASPHLYVYTTTVHLHPHISVLTRPLGRVVGGELINKQQSLFVQTTCAIKYQCVDIPTWWVWIVRTTSIFAHCPTTVSPSYFNF